MRKDTTKKLLMREDRHSNRMLSIELVDFLIRKKKRIAYDTIDFINVFGTKSTHLNIKNTSCSGVKTREMVSKDNKIVTFNMVYCEEGSFTMGHMDLISTLKPNPPRLETIERPFWLGETEVTQELYELVMGNNPSYFRGLNEFPNESKHPVEQVSWIDAVLFCNELSRLQGLQECYTKVSKRDKYPSLCDFSKNGYRLPYEKEWEYAAKVGTNNRYAGCDDVECLSEYAWYKDNSNNHTHPVATKQPNEWGLYDMIGNVFEWCWDKYDPNITSIYCDHITRGHYYGAYDDAPISRLASDIRKNAGASFANKVLGFRICRTF